MQSGQVIAGKYRLNQLLGTGGMATVWSATNVFTDRQFAIKFMLPSVARTTPEAAKRFLMEAKASARINHPNIIEIIDVGQAEDQSLFLVMELLSGISLEVATRRQNPPMTIHSFLVVMQDVAAALSAAHKSGVIHRDLKPSNIFLHKDRQGIAVPKLLDFGVSKFLEEETGSRNGALTVAGTVLGSPLYMSPEQAMGSSGIDGRTDIFAFGAILFEALVGYRCFDAPNFNALIVTIATSKPKSIDEVAPQLPESVRSLVRDCLVVEKKRRLANFDLVYERLGQIVNALQNDPTRLPPPHAPASDPDATNAMPALVRPSDRPPPPSPYLSSSGVQVAAPHVHTGSYSSPWTPSFAGLSPAKGPTTWLVAGGVAAVGLLVLGIGAAIFGVTRPRAHHVDASASTPVSATTPTAPASDVNAGPTAQTPTTRPARGMGHLLVSANPGWCTLYVDGSSRGSTPVAAQLSAGPHQLRCDPPTGEPKTVSLTVLEGGTASYTFSFQ